MLMVKEKIYCECWGLLNLWEVMFHCCWNFVTTDSALILKNHITILLKNPNKLNDVSGETHELKSIKWFYFYSIDFVLFLF